MALGVTHYSRHGRDCDDRGAKLIRRALGLNGSLKEGQERDGGEVHGRNISAVTLIPLLG